MAGKPFYDVQAYCPTRNTSGTEVMTMSLYKWDADYGKTVSGAPVARKRFGSLGLGLHNVGLSGDAAGHFDISAPEYIGYAYGIGDAFPWGQWNTMWNPLKVTTK